MVELPPEIYEHLANMTAADWDILTTRVRAPDAKEALRDAAKRYLSEEAADAFAAMANLSAFTDEDGAFSEVKAQQHLGSLFGNGAPQPNWGQHGSGEGFTLPPGGAGAAEAKRRNAARGYAASGDETAAQATELGTNVFHGPGSGGAAEAARRAAKGAN